MVETVPSGQVGLLLVLPSLTVTSMLISTRVTSAVVSSPLAAQNEWRPYVPSPLPLKAKVQQVAGGVVDPQEAVLQEEEGELARFIRTNFKKTTTFMHF